MIEMIVVLVIVGVLAAVAGMGIVTAVRGYMFSQQNASFSEKSLTAIARLNRELMECYTCKYTGTATISSPFTYYNPLGKRIITWGSNITLSDGTNTDTLIEGVNSVTLVYDSANDYKSFLLTVVLNHPSGGTQTFTTNIYPRNSVF